MFNVTQEERDDIIRVLAQDENEAVGSMGDDTPMPVLSHRVRSLYDYFRQQFAQVTNPPIDPLREIDRHVAADPDRTRGQHLRAGPRACAPGGARLADPLAAQAAPDPRHRGGHARVSSTCSTPRRKGCGLRWRGCARRPRAAVREGKLVLLLSDRYLVRDRIPVHALLATGAVHQHLVNTGLRCKCNLLVETGTAREPHHFACLIGYGATAVYPYMAYQVLFEMMRKGRVKLDFAARLELGRSYRAGVRKGLFKIMSKMGISTISSYRSSQLFEIVGLADEVVQLCFTGTESRVQGADFDDLESDMRELAQRAWNPREPIEQGGLLKYVHDGEYHMYNPDVIAALQAAVVAGDYGLYRQYAALVNERPASTLPRSARAQARATRSRLREVEPVEAVLARFDSAGMSLGALSPEAHEALAIAMNRLGARSNSGEGGEDPARYGTEKNSKIKQVASGRFGVTPEYLINAEVLQIKIAQGAKPGEGGQLPGHKVNDMIATLRFARPGVGLISPPPHHDIYSIEDLAQLIFDLKQVNPRALVSVKLVAEPGVGTVAAGVAKAYADLITISGYDGGTGASPLSSIKYAGTPWELGLAETHQTLRAE